MAVTLRNTLPDGGTIDFPPDLPISEHADEIAEAIASHQVVVVAGETGSGKTTQLPKICLGLGRTRIAHTQPRRIAARSVAARIAEELDTPLGDAVGYQVRFDEKTSDATVIKLMTDGMLLAAAQAVASQVDPTTPGTSLLPPVENLRASSATVAVAVARQAEADGVATASHDNLIQAVQDAMWQPVYPEVEV